MYYLKESIDDIEELFKPYNFSGESLKQNNVKLPIYKNKRLYDNVCHHFAYWDEFDYTSDCICMDEYLDNNSIELEKMIVEVDYNEIEGIIEKKSFESFVLEYIKVLQDDYWLNFNSILSKGNMLDASKIFKEKILSLKSCLNSLEHIQNTENLNWFQSNIIKGFCSSYKEVIKKINIDYGDVFPSLIRGYLLVKTTTLNHTNVEKYLKPLSLETFFEYEKKLIDRGYLDSSMHWVNKEMKNLVLFFKYIRKTELLKEHFNRDDNNDFLKILEKRYDFSVGDQRKPSKYNKQNYSFQIATAEYYFL